MQTRRELLVTGTALTTAALAGCSGSTTNESTPEVDGDIVVGPDNTLIFDPESVTVSTGEEVTWSFASANHNVSCDPNHSDKAALPENAEAFASYDGDDKYRTNEIGTSFSHTFDTPGTYTYVCIPHVTNGMVGEVVVE